MRITKALFSILISTGAASASVVWNTNGNNGNLLQASNGETWYTFSGESATFENLSNVSAANGKLVLLVDAVKSAGYAGAGLNWNNSGTATNISSNNGVCLTYRAAKKFRVNITSSYGAGNHYGYVVDPASEYTVKYIPFADMTQETGWGTTFTKATGLAASTGVQIMVKGSYYSGNFTNAVEVVEVGLGDVCGTTAVPAKGTAVTKTGLIFDAFNALPSTAVNTLGGAFDTYSSGTSNTVSPASGAMSTYLAANKAVGFSATLAGTGYPSAGVSMAWGSALADISANDSLCVVYKSSAALRMNLKQSGMEYNTNYYGAALAASTKWAVKKMPVSSFTQETGWGYATPLDLTRQLALLFEYKGTAGASVTAQIAQVGFGGSCAAPTSAPVVQSPYNDATHIIEMEDNDTVKIALKDILQDPYDDALTFEIGEPSSANLSAAVIKDTLYLYTKVNVSGTATLDIIATDSDNEKNDATLSINIKDVNHAPVAVDDAYSVAEDSVLTMTAAKGVLLNDYSQDELDFAISASTQPKHGTLTLNDDGSLTYTPVANYSGKDTATYVIKDSRDSLSKAAKIIITVTAVNDPPTIKSNNITVTESYDEDFASFKTISIAFTDLAFDDVDGETLNYSAVGKGIQASLINTPNTTGATAWKLQLKSVKNFSGAATVTIYAYDTKDSVFASFSITINPSPDAVIAANDTYKGFEDSVLTVNAKTGVLANDTNPDPSAVTEITLVTAPKNGTLKLAADGSFTYTQTKENRNGADTATYTVTTENGLVSNEAKIFITIAAVNDAPTLTTPFDTLYVKEDFATSIQDLGKHFTDQEGDSIFYGATAPGSLVQLVILRNYLYIQKVADANGTSKIKIAAWNKGSDTTYAEMIVVIEPVNDRPEVVIQKDTIIYKTDTLKVHIGNLFKDIDGDSLTFMLFKPALDSTQAWISNDTLLIYAKNAKAAIYQLPIRAADADTVSNLAYVYVNVTGTSAINPQSLMPLSGWSAALAGTKNSVELYALNGKLVLKMQAGISPAELKQKAKAYNMPLILKIDNNTWMFKK